MTNDVIDTLCHYIDRMKVLHLSLPGPLLERFRNNRNPIPRTKLEKLFIGLVDQTLYANLTSVVIYALERLRFVGTT